MSDNELIARAYPKWVRAVGKKNVIRRLVLRGVPPDTAEPIGACRYVSTPRDLLAQALLVEMRLDGFDPLQK